MGSMTGVLLCIAICFLKTAWSVYVDDTYPYDLGRLSTSEHHFNISEGIPIHTRVYYPDDPTITAGKTFAVHVYIGGFKGRIPGASYGDVLGAMASHGYVVIAPWTRGENHQEFGEAMLWLKDNMGPVIGVTADWNYTTLGCHSSGCENILEIMQLYPFTEDNVKAIAFTEPFSVTIANRTSAYYVPAFMYGTVLADGRCTYGIGDYAVFYDIWQCPRMKFNVVNFGHCDCLDAPGWLFCNNTGFCETGPALLIDQYKLFMQGILVCISNTYAQGSPAYMDYMLIEENLTVSVTDFATDWDCPAAKTGSENQQTSKDTEKISAAKEDHRSHK